MASFAAGKICRRKKRFSGISWIFIAVVLFFMIGGIASFFAPKFQRAGGGSFGMSATPRSYFGVSGFENTDGGVTFDDVEPAGGPADKAGLVGGDVITTFDGHPIHSDSEMMGRLAETPVGKTVDVVFIRDGETKLTKITTVSKAEFDQLVASFRRRPEGQGMLGIDNQKVVEVPGTKIRGVRFTVDSSKAAAIAGLRDGDIVIEFDKVPIRTNEELTARIRRAVPYVAIPVVVMRGDERLEIPVKVGRR
jgi:S1-C subfamily serine protease